MGISTYIYKGWQDEASVFYDIKTKKRTSVPKIDVEDGRFSRNYIFMEWLEKRLGFEIQDGEYYVLYEDDIKALLEDCELVIDLIKDENKNNIVYEFSDELREQIIKIFPQNNWNKEDFSHWDKENNQSILIPHKFNMGDYEKVKLIRDTFSNLIGKYVDKVIVYNSL